MIKKLLRGVSSRDGENRTLSLWESVSLNYTLDGRQVTGARRVRIESLLVMIDACCEGS